MAQVVEDLSAASMMTMMMRDDSLIQFAKRALRKPASHGAQPSEGIRWESLEHPLARTTLPERTTGIFEHAIVQQENLGKEQRRTVPVFEVCTHLIS